MARAANGRGGNSFTALVHNLKRSCANGRVDPSELSTSIVTELRGCGLADPEVFLEQVPELSRQVSGKLKRFVPRATSS
jgi:hypothetical protein